MQRGRQHRDVHVDQPIASTVEPPDDDHYDDIDDGPVVHDDAVHDCLVPGHRFDGGET